jgi:xylulose-5-phosphate/fructose-6-phosphate phosphoketolase
MVVRNRVSRYHLCQEVLRRSRHRPEGSDRLVEHCKAMLAAHELHITEHLEDLPEVRDWVWQP